MPSNAILFITENLWKSFLKFTHYSFHSSDIECQFPKTPLGVDSGCSIYTSDTDLTDQEEVSLSPRLRRRRRRRRRNQPHYFGYLGNEEVDYLNNLPEEGRMVEITSNIWGTKFKIHGLDISLPPLLGQVNIYVEWKHMPRSKYFVFETFFQSYYYHFKSNH